ncbi:MAG: zinc-binding dehydrogenase [Chloroflexota bacterium]|nr:zinc-binding dehydrogenase [Dehalococcoidia bacterium]MDW8253152.1 zinc-binding dehydrogenase [Chloroflexota bacterium]
MTLPETMRAAVLLAPRRVAIQTLPVPRPGPGEVVVEVTTALTCGTELKSYRQGHRLFRPPWPLGHEFVGYVAALGEGVTSVALGERVVAANSAPCDQCEFCRAGRTPLCRKLPDLLLRGAFADYVLLSSPIVRHNFFRAPPGVPDETLAFLEPLACVVHGADEAAVAPGETVAIIGGTGPIGLLFVQLLRHRGAGRVVAVGRKPHRLALAKELGATETLQAAEEDWVRRLLTEVGRPDVVIEITGIPALIEQAVAIAQPGGRVVLFGGSPAGATAALDLARVHYDALTVRGVFHHTPRTVRQALQLLTSGAIRVAPLVSDRLPLEETAEAMRRFDAGELKLAIAPGGRPPAVR